MPIKLNFFYTCGPWGFSETYYKQGSDPLSVVNGVPDKMLRALINWRSPFCRLVAVRGSTTTAPKKSYLRSLFGDYAGTALGSTAGEQLDVPQTDMVVRLSGAGGHTRRAYFRGMRDLDVMMTDEGFPNPRARLFTGMQQLVKLFTSEQFQIRFTLLPPDSIKPWTNVIAVEPDGTEARWTKLTAVTSAVSGYNVGDYLVFNGAPSRTLPRFPRIARIVDKDLSAVPLYITVEYAIPGGQFHKVSKMRFTELNYSYETIQTQAIERFSEHKTGKPFGQLRGRSRGVARVT